MKVIVSLCLSVHTGGVPISHNALQHLPRMPWGSWGGGEVPCQVQVGEGTLPGPAGGVPCQGGGYPARVRGWVPCQGVPCWGGTLPGGTLPGGGTQLGQHREYLLHGGRYASCVHAGGLSCCQLKSYL